MKATSSFVDSCPNWKQGASNGHPVMLLLECSLECSSICQPMPVQSGGLVLFFARGRALGHDGCDVRAQHGNRNWVRCNRNWLWLSVHWLLKIGHPFNWLRTVGADSDLTQRGAKLETGAVGSIQVQDQARARSITMVPLNFMHSTQVTKNTVLLLPFLHFKEKVRRHVMELLVAWWNLNLTWRLQ